MEMYTPNLSRWTTEDLLTEVIRRTACDASALEAMQTFVIRARLEEGDRRSAAGTQPELVPARERAGVGTTIELGLEE